MQTPTVTFVETMRGQVVMARVVVGGYGAGLLATPEFEDDQAIVASLRQGAQRDLALPMVWQDLAIAVKNELADKAHGLSGVIEGGTIVVGGLAAAALTIQQGEFSLLPTTPQGERRMRYRLTCQAQDGRRYLLYGFKRIANTGGRLLPVAIWQDTTTLYVTIYAVDEQGALTTLAASGVIHIHLVDFLQQLLTMRSRGVTGMIAQLRNLAAFGRFFAGTVAAVYLTRAKPMHAQSLSKNV
ncbi:MAG: hypothetical protein R3E79_25740 [Caldilineaceae bacterium]